MVVLHGYAPDVVPQVLVDDLLPDHRWRWFLMADAGECDQTGIVPACAVEAALRLGRLQRSVCEETRLAQWLPNCRAKGLQEDALGVCDWALPTVAAEGRGELLRLRTRLAGATTFFSEVAARLAPLPATCAHGDFWSGNIACGAAGVRIVDWGDAVWGVGSVSIANLLAAERDHLAGHEEAVWAAYGRGLEREMTEPVMAASGAAARVTSLVVDVEIARCCGMGAEELTGLMPGLRGLAEMDGV